MMTVVGKLNNTLCEKEKKKDQHMLSFACMRLNEQQQCWLLSVLLHFTVHSLYDGFKAVSIAH